MKKVLQKVFGGSCGNCEKVHDLLHVIIDDEANAEEEKFFKEHIDECSPCLEKYNVEKSLIEKIKSKINHKCCPKSLVDSIRESIKGTPS